MEPTTWSLVKDLALYALPVSAAQVLQYLMNPILLYAAGRLGVANIGATSLAISLFNATAFSVAVGIGGGLDTLLSQIYGRNPTDRHYGLISQRMLLLLLVLSLPLMTLFACLRWPLELIRLNPEVAHLTADYTRVSLAGIPIIMAFEVTRRYLQNQGATIPQAAAQGVAVAVLGPLLYLCVHVSDLGQQGIAVAWAVAFAIALGCVVVYTRCIAWGRFGVTWFPAGRSMFHGWGTLARQGVPSFLMTCVEWTGIEVSNISGGFLGTQDLAAFSIVLQMLGLFWNVTSGVYFACSFFVGECVGSGNPLLARRYAALGAVLVLCLTVVDGALAVLLWKPVAELFTDDPVVVEKVRHIAYVMAAFHQVDSQQSNILQVLRGCGKQRYGAAVMCVSWLLIGFPLNFILTFWVRVGPLGLFAGIFAATACVSLPSYAYLLLWHFDWAAMKPVEHDAVPLSFSDDDSDGIHDIQTPLGAALDCDH